MAEIDRLLPAGGLLSAGLHEIKPEMPGDAMAALGFALGLAALRQSRHRQVHGMAGGMVWVQPIRDAAEYGRLYAPGLLPFGLDPGGLIVVEPKTSADALWAIEESLKGDEEDRAAPLAFVLACIAASLPGAGAKGGRRRALDATAQRRLALAAARGETPCLLLTSHDGPGLESAHTRWRVGRRPNQPSHLGQSSQPGRTIAASIVPPAARPNVPPASIPSVGAPTAGAAPVRTRACPAPELFPARGHCRLRVRLERCRGGGAMLEEEGRNFDLEWCDEAYRFRLVASLAGRAPGIADAWPEVRQEPYRPPASLGRGR